MSNRRYDSCQHCFQAPPAVGQNGYCTPQCRFLSKVERGDGDACWTWKGARNTPDKGYGRIFVNRRRHLAHRYSYELFTGQIPQGFEVDHTCGNAGCVNPAHLDAITPEEHDRRTDFGAANRSKSECPAGHRYSGSNLRLGKRGKRYCRACDRIRNANPARRARQR